MQELDNGCGYVGHGGVCLRAVFLYEKCFLMEMYEVKYREIFCKCDEKGCTKRPKAYEAFGNQSLTYSRKVLLDARATVVRDFLTNTLCNLLVC